MLLLCLLSPLRGDRAKLYELAAARVMFRQAVLRPPTAPDAHQEPASLSVVGSPSPGGELLGFEESPSTGPERVQLFRCIVLTAGRSNPPPDRALGQAAPLTVVVRLLAWPTRQKYSRGHR